MSTPKRQLAVARDLFKAHFHTFLNPENPLLVLAVKWLKLRLLRVVRDFYRKCTYIDYELESLLDMATQIALLERDTKNKIYSIHEPETTCISKGKAHKKYWFGQKQP
ncbi:MAG: hypothetical protein V3V10_08435 [Planctomycetota bacterium]